MAKLKAIVDTTGFGDSGAGSGPPMGDKDHLQLPVTEIQGSEDLVTEEGIQNTTSLRSEARKQNQTEVMEKSEAMEQNQSEVMNVSENLKETLEGSQSIPIRSDQKPGEWVNAVQGKKVLTKYDMDIQMEDGVGSVRVPDEVFKDAAPLWEDFLIGRFLDKAPHIGKVHAIVNKIWALSDKSQMIDVYVINSTTMKFRVSNPVTRNRIVRRAMWNIAEIPVIMAKWSPLTEDIEQETHSIPLWVHLKNVPMDMFTWKGLSFVTSPVGIPTRLHPDTEQCLNLKVAKVFVKADLSKELPKSMNFTFQGKKTLVEYTYPWLPPKCSQCNKWGHLARVCRRRNDEDKEKEELKEIDKEEGNGSEKVVVGSVSKEAEFARVEDVTKSVSMKENGNIMEVLEKSTAGSSKERKGERAWTVVSPGKTRTPVQSNKLEFGQVSILSKSRFSVLSHEEEEGEIKEQTEMEVSSKEEGVENNEEGSGSDKEEELEKELVREDEVVGLRKFLPRGSKAKHRFLSDVSVQRARDDGLRDPNKKKKPRNAR